MRLLTSIPGALGFVALGILPHFAIAQDEKPGLLFSGSQPAISKSVAPSFNPMLPSLKATSGRANDSPTESDEESTPVSNISDADSQTTLLLSPNRLGSGCDSDFDSRWNVYNFCATCAHRRAWFGADYLRWRTPNQTLPPLLTTSTTIGAAGNNAGALTDPNTRILIDRVEGTYRDGARFHGGFYFGCQAEWGIDGTYFFLDRQSGTQDFNGTETPLLARPIVVSGADTALYVNNPFIGFTNGRFIVNDVADLHGFDVNLRRKLWTDSNLCVDLLMGYRNLRLRERIEIVDIEEFGGQQNTPFENFGTRNDFHGGQFGFSGEWELGPRFTLNGVVKVAFGNMHETVDINGITVFRPFAGGGAVGTGGILALASNSGRRERDHFAVVPEVGLKFGWNLTCNLRLQFGYDFLFMSNVVRPGDQIDRRVNPAMLPSQFVLNPGIVNPALPAPQFNTTSYFAHGLNFGVAFHW